MNPTNQDWREQRRQERWTRRQERWGRHHPNPLAGAMLGLVLIGGGVLFLLRNLNIFYFDSIWDFWPVILIVIGGSKLISPRCNSDFVGGLIIGGIGVVFLLRNLGYIYGNMWSYIWPTFFIAIGISMLMRNFARREAWAEGSPGIVDESNSSATRIHADVIFGNTKRHIVSQEFEGGKISVFFGGAEIDLRGAGTKLSEVRLEADAAFGGIEIKVPNSWQVEVRGSGFFGGYEDRAHHPTNLPGAPKLIVTGSALFGGVSVRN